MLVLDDNDHEVVKPDLSKGYLFKEIRIKPDAEPVDDITKFAWDDSDYEEIQRYRLYTEEDIESFRSIKRNAQMKSAVSLFVRNTNLSDEEALAVSMLHEDWKPDTPYVKGDRRLYEGVLYRCIEDHVSQTTWTPMASPSLWAKILPGQSGDIGVWEQPGPTNPYRKGDRVTHNGKTWTSDIDGNIWEPGVYGWTEVDLSPEDQYPEYVAGKSYYKGDKITYGGERYECICTEGLPCVWSPTDYPAGWKKVQ